MITLYADFKKDRYSYLLSIGWSLIITSGFFIYISSLGIFDKSFYFPYYPELSITIESLILSFLLADKIKQLNREKIMLKDNLILQQKNEKEKLSMMVEEKTEALNSSLYEKELLLRELNHRVKNSIQTIVSFLRLQIGELEEKQTQQLLRNIENRIMSISHLYSLLYTKENICFVNTHEYFSLLVEDIETSYAMPHVTIELKAEINIPSEYAIYCGFILNECITNSLQHAFNDRESGKIIVHLKEEKSIYKLSLCDNGIGYNSNTHNDSLGLVIIETLVVMQLKGKLKVMSKDGTKIDIEWRANG
jgi:two-component sensor histidine kinase